MSNSLSGANIVYAKKLSMFKRTISGYDELVIAFDAEDACNAMLEHIRRESCITHSYENESLLVPEVHDWTLVQQAHTMVCLRRSCHTHATSSKATAEQYIEYFGRGWIGVVTEDICFQEVGLMLNLRHEQERLSAMATTPISFGAIMAELAPNNWHEPESGAEKAINWYSPDASARGIVTDTTAN